MCFDTIVVQSLVPLGMRVVDGWPDGDSVGGSMGCDRVETDTQLSRLSHFVTTALTSDVH